MSWCLSYCTTLLTFAPGTCEEKQRVSNGVNYICVSVRGLHVLCITIRLLYTSAHSKIFIGPHYVTDSVGVPNLLWPMQLSHSWQEYQCTYWHWVEKSVCYSWLGRNSYKSLNKLVIGCILCNFKPLKHSVCAIPAAQMMQYTTYYWCWHSPRVLPTSVTTVIQILIRHNLQHTTIWTRFVSQRVPPPSTWLMTETSQFVYVE